MAHGKETPRQKMIGMMYLVLTAMLALNVSRSVLDAFTIIEEGLGKTKSTIKTKLDEVYKDFDYQEELNPAKVTPWHTKALEIKKMANSLVDTVQNLKVKTVIAAEGDKTDAVVDGVIYPEKIVETTDYDTPARIMIGTDLTKNSKAAILKNNVELFKEKLLTLCEDNEKLKNSVSKSLETEDQVNGDGEKVSWEYHKFGHSPLVGFLAIMSSLQIDVRNAESEVLNYLYSQIDAGAVKFNQIEATVIPNSNYIIRGTNYSAQVFLAARDTTQDPTIYVTNNPNPYDSTLKDGVYTYKKRPGVKYDSLPIVNGKGKYTVPENSNGSRTWGGIIKLTGPSGDIYRPFKQSYRVAEGSVVVSPTKMNVFYLGVDNPVDISVGSVPPDKIFPQITNASMIKKSGGSYIVRPKRPGNSIVTVFADIDGQQKRMGSQEFRVKIVPNPVAKINGQTGGLINKNLLLAQIGVTAEMENFDFDLKFTVTEFTVSATVQGFVRDAKSSNNRFTNEQMNIIRTLGRGARLYIQDIKAVGPDGSLRPLSTINFVLN